MKKCLFLLFGFISLILAKKELDIKEDFTLEIDYRLENTETNWRKRGDIKFLQKSSNKNYKPSVNVINEQLTKDQFDELKTECKNGNGLYYIRVKTQNNFFFNQLSSCELLENNLYDRFIIAHFGPIKNDQIISISYDVDYSKVGSLSSLNANFISTVEFVDNVASSGPLFPEEKEKAQQQQQTEQSFFQKYWWIIMIVMFMMVMKGPAPEEGASGEAQQ